MDSVDQSGTNESPWVHTALPSPVPVKVQYEELSILPVETEEVSVITVEKKENEDRLNTDDEDVVKVTLPSLRSDKAYTQTESDNAQDTKNHKGRIEDCSMTSVDPEKTKNTDKKANNVSKSNSKGCGLLYKAGRQTSKPSMTVQLDSRIGQTSNLSDFDRGMIIGARCAGSSISEAADRLGFSRSTVSKVYKECTNSSKKS
ncbi:hypothetical protein DPEC_G00266600 [Dallia pectoralis]|uniref:Uncharacterized protein n=1 Tax=Dallia pectoralis TaxID=75939 RepID=A0ACC2FNA6_DALPE|nr:hypothetical protein DPEC_G00266600 [Dallia pectoralis]